ISISPIAYPDAAVFTSPSRSSSARNRADANATDSPRPVTTSAVIPADRRSSSTRQPGGSMKKSQITKTQNPKRNQNPSSLVFFETCYLEFGISALAEVRRQCCSCDNLRADVQQLQHTDCVGVERHRPAAGRRGNALHFRHVPQLIRKIARHPEQVAGVFVRQRAIGCREEYRLRIAPGEVAVEEEHAAVGRCEALEVFGE